ncbi:Glycosyltransferase involved in cell wall bisynthesis [Roseivivax marinus]|uniref:glycosyltransferase family 2 protein n=1 Tax=Roseivivax marinus TaxID=1379903 RepID=UPI0008C0F7D2|nr:glycosyltransferase family 2 protein [Roseivivax marinus]SEK69335.1 Glycosyltransferase involved in cell wall bisynthesis [Roseivivax marinus]
MTNRTMTPEPGGQLVSIGLPVYNGADYVAEAIDCLRRQTHGNIEIIISDNCSTDETPAICEQVARQDPRIRYSRTDRNLGAAGNFNRVARLARGPFFAWANHDDRWADSYIEQCLEALDDRRDAVLAYARSEKIDETGRTLLSLNANLRLGAERPSDRLRRYHDHFIAVDRRRGWGREPIEGFWIPVYGLVRTEALMRTPLIRDFISSDTVLIEDLLLLGAFVEIDEVLFYKRDHQDRSMRDSESYDARAEWFTGRAPSRLLLPRWRMIAARLGSAARLPQSTGQKLACLAEVLSFYVRRRSETNALVKEILANAERLLRRGDQNARVFEKW